MVPWLSSGGDGDDAAVVADIDYGGVRFGAVGRDGLLVVTEMAVMLEMMATTMTLLVMIPARSCEPCSQIAYMWQQTAWQTSMHPRGLALQHATCPDHCTTMAELSPTPFPSCQPPLTRPTAGCGSTCASKAAVAAELHRDVRRRSWQARWPSRWERS